MNGTPLIHPGDTYPLLDKESNGSIQESDQGDDLVARVSAASSVLDPEKSEDKSLRRICASRHFGDRKLMIKILAATGLVLFLGLVGAAIYLSAPRPTTQLQCRPTQLPAYRGPFGQGRRTAEPTDTRLLNQNQTVVLASVVEEKVLHEREQFDLYEKMFFKTWKGSTPQEKEDCAKFLAQQSEQLAKSYVTCLTGEQYGSQPYHATIADFMRLPFAFPNTTQFEKIFTVLRSLNQNFTQPINNALFVSICQDFLDNAMLRNKDKMLNEDTQWVVADFSSWISTIKNALTAYTETVTNSFFKVVDPKVTAAIGYQPGFIELAVAPPRDQVVGLQNVSDQVVAKFCDGNHTFEEAKKLQALYDEIMTDIPYAQYSALTGKSFYAKIKNGSVKWTPFDYTTVTLFDCLYNWYNDGFLFRVLWVNDLQPGIDHGEEGFEKERVQNLIYALQSVAESRNGTRGYLNWGYEITVDMSEALERIQEGVRFGNEIWRPIQRTTPL